MASAFALRGLLLLACLARSGAGPGRAPTCNLANVTRILTPGSRALRDYVTHVYGEESDEAAARKRDADFAEKLECCVDMLYGPLLPVELRVCSWSRVGTVYGSVYFLQNYYIQPRNSLWIYRHREAGCPHEKTNNMTALPVPPTSLRLHNHSAEWVEVSHTFTGHYAERSGLFFMYRAVGSGLWYKLGHTLEVRTHEEAMARANATDWEQVHTWLLSQGYGSLVVTHRCEHWGAAWMSEVIDVPGVAHQPPPQRQRATAETSAALALAFLTDVCLVRFARGYAPLREPCSCCAWAAAKPTWCASGVDFSVRFGLGDQPQPAGTLNTRGVPPIIAQLAAGGKRAAALSTKAGRELASGSMPLGARRRGAAPAKPAATNASRALPGSAQLPGRQLQLGLSDLVRDPAGVVPGKRVYEADTIHFFHMICAQPPAHSHRVRH